MILVNLELSSPCPLLSPWQVSLRLKRLWIWWKYPVSWCLRQQHQWKQQQQLVNNDPRGTRSNECTCLHLQQRWWRVESTNSQIQPEVAQRIETKNLCHITTYLKSKEWFLISNLFNLYKSRENIFSLFSSKFSKNKSSNFFISWIWKVVLTGLREFSLNCINWTPPMSSV